MEAKKTGPASSTVNRSVPYLICGTSEDDSKILLDRYEFPIEQLYTNQLFAGKLQICLDISAYGEVITPQVLIELLSEQFAAASEFVYGHPLWEDIRSGSKAALYSYLMETRHYLAAATSRMSPSIGQGIGLQPLTLLLSRHLLEEWDHAKFFADALQVLGCGKNLVSCARPLPATLEWIHATRAIGFKSGLSAAVCSGFMEFSSTETAAVKSWHKMLVESGLLPEAANTSIFHHVETDLEFGHSDNWHHAIEAVGDVTPECAAEILNDVSTIAEMIYRWLSALRSGCAADVVAAMQIMTELGCNDELNEKASEFDVAVFRGVPVWPASSLKVLNGGFGGSAASRIVLAAAYAFGEYGNILSRCDTEFTRKVNWIISSLSTSSPENITTPEDADTLTATWLRSIDGHDLWSEMQESPTDGLLKGYIVENYHYLASAARHIGAAISACPDSELRIQLISHFEDELEHCSILKSKLNETFGIADVDRLRPLPTTLAFVGHLEILGRTDWKAYILTSAFLQNSLSVCREDQRNDRFYQSVTSRSSHAAAMLLGSIWQHDAIDGELGHDDRPKKRLAFLLNGYGLPSDAIGQAAITPLLAWSFLDGILQHYRHGDGCLVQRIGWTAR